MLSIAGAWTKAGVVSCVRVRGEDRGNDILLDCGAIEDGVLSAKVVLISHGHTDHVGAVVIHARARALNGEPANYYVPAEIIEPLQTIRAGFEAMDGHTIPMNIIPIHPGDSVMITHNVLVKVFPTEHRVPSQGYALYTRRSGRLLSQFQNLPPQEIGRLKKSGVAIHGPPEDVLEIVYTGDTTFQGLLRRECRFIFQAPVLIMELTYLDRDVAKAVDRGHVHIQDIIDHEDVFENATIVFVHLSQRYSPASALEILRRRLPRSIAQRAKVSLQSFGVREVLTSVFPDFSEAQGAPRSAPAHGYRGNRVPGAGWTRNNRYEQPPRFHRKQRKYSGRPDSGGGFEPDEEECC